MQYPLSKIKERWGWDGAAALATRTNAKLAVKLTGNSYGVTVRALPYLKPWVGMEVKTSSGETGKIVALNFQMRNPNIKLKDPSAKIELADGSFNYLFQTAMNGYGPTANAITEAVARIDRHSLQPHTAQHGRRRKKRT